MINRFESAFKCSALSLAMVTVLTGCATVKVHPEFNKRHETMEHLLLLPPDAKAYEITFNAGQKPIKELMDSMKATSAEALKTAMEKKGYKITALELKQEDLDANSALKDAFFELKKLYEQAVIDMKANKKKNFTYEVGSAGNYFAEKHGVNAIVYIREVGTRLSGGVNAAQVASASLSIATALLTGVAIGPGIQPQYSLMVEAAVIDADLGDILWYNLKEARDSFNNPADKKTVTKFVTEAVGPFPDSKFKSASAAQKKDEPKKEQEPPKQEAQGVSAQAAAAPAPAANFSPRVTR